MHRNAEGHRVSAQPTEPTGPLGPPLPEPIVGRLAVVGIGLIGSSIIHACKARRVTGRIIAIDHDPTVLERCAALGLGDERRADLAGVAGCDLIILCIPVGAFAAVAEAMAPHLKAGAVVSDVGSVKGSVIAQTQPHLPAGVHLVPAHPVAGTEYSGPDAGFATLFQRRWCILTPPEGTDTDAVELVERFWLSIGADVEIMTAKHHDKVLAITSHVPHLIAYNIVGTAADLETVTESEVIKFSAGGFRDFTRIAASDPTMWRDVFLHNREAVLEMLGRLNEDVAILARAIRWGDGETLFNLFTRTRAIRRGIISQGQETPEPDFGRRHAEAPAASLDLSVPNRARE
jgi:cyclohexadieny/prephenate dehydrogenase